MLPTHTYLLGTVQQIVILFSKLLFKVSTNNLVQPMFANVSYVRPNLSSTATAGTDDSTVREQVAPQRLREATHSAGELFDAGGL